MRTSGIITAVVACIALPSTAFAQQKPLPATAGVPTFVPSFERNTSSDAATERDTRPIIACALSVFLPGAGQFYNGHRGKGSLMFAGFAASLAIAATQGLDTSFPAHQPTAPIEAVWQC